MGARLLQKHSPAMVLFPTEVFIFVGRAILDILQNPEHLPVARSEFDDLFRSAGSSGTVFLVRVRLSTRLGQGLAALATGKNENQAGEKDATRKIQRLGKPVFHSGYR